MPENPEARKRVTRTAILDLEDMAQFLAPDSASALRELVKFYERRSPDDASYIEGGIVLDTRIVSPYAPIILTRAQYEELDKPQKLEVALRKAN